jgi:hypothetical protein
MNFAERSLSSSFSFTAIFSKGRSILPNRTISHSNQPCIHAINSLSVILRFYFVLFTDSYYFKAKKKFPPARCKVLPAKLRSESTLQRV